jgi:exonuclease SbcD
MMGEQTDTKVIVISGNHDSQTLIDTGNIILDSNQFFFQTKLDPTFHKNIISLKVKGKNIFIKTLPYFRNFELYQFNKEHGVDDIEDTSCIQKYLEDQSYLKDGDINLFMGHHGFGEFSGSGSEQAISLSGLSSIPIDWIAHHDYCALGHIHKYQNLTKDHRVSYCGSPYQMRFSESQKKYLNLITFEKNKTQISKIEIDLYRKLVQVKTDLTNYQHDIETALRGTQSILPPFVEVLIKMDSPSSNLADEIRKICTDNNSLLLSFSPIFLSSDTQDEKESISLKKLDMVQMLGEFHKQKFNDQDISDELLVKFHQMMDTISHEDQ